jgi:hypothetical protein
VDKGVDLSTALEVAKAVFAEALRPSNVGRIEPKRAQTAQNIAPMRNDRAPMGCSTASTSRYRSPTSCAGLDDARHDLGLLWRLRAAWRGE